MSHPSWRHELYVYDDDRTFTERMTPFLDEGLGGEEAVVVVTDRERFDALRGAIGPSAERMAFVDRATFYTRPLAALAAYDAHVRRALRDGAPAVRLFGELPFVDTREEWDEWVAYDAILNRAFAHHPAWVVCGYDARALPAAVVEGARRAHPKTFADTSRTGTSYEDPERLVPELLPAAMPVGRLACLPADGDARAIRERLAGAMSAAGVPEVEAVNMLLAVDEVVANARRHAAGPTAVRAGRVGERFVAEVTDAGPGLDDPLAGYLPPRPGHASGAGLWVARQVTRQLDLMSSPDGLTVRLWV
jgi:anti-sigma regulatory factor (Ser/Thr protein kinase)